VIDTASDDCRSLKWQAGLHQSETGNSDSSRLSTLTIASTGDELQLSSKSAVSPNALLGDTVSCWSQSATNDSTVNPLQTVTLSLTPQSRHFYVTTRPTLTYENGTFLLNGQFTGRCFSFQQLQYPGPYPVGVDARRRESYLSPQDFLAVFAISRDQYALLPLWRQNELRKSKLLF
jgi:hypothetical protein